ncbi:MAG: hypothetical protein WC413_02995 [Candidatus Nanoarchaeia archaeon]
MNIESLKQICEQEFRKMDGLYHITDTIIVKPDFGSNRKIRCEYLSNRYSLDYINGKLGDYDQETKITFYKELNECSIGFLSVIPLVKNMGFGRKMVETVENIFRLIGANKLKITDVQNPSFWEHFGYGPNNEVGDLGEGHYSNWEKMLIKP